MVTPPREPDRFEAILDDWDRRFNRPASRRSMFDRADLLAYLRAAEVQALERAAQAIEAIEGGGSLYRNGLHAAAARVRAIVSPESPPGISETQYMEAAEARNEPAAAPAADYDPITAPIPEGDMNGPHGPLPSVGTHAFDPAWFNDISQSEYCEHCGKTAAEHAPPSEPVAPAPEPVNCWIQLRNAETRIAELEAALRKATVQIGILLDRMRGCDDEIKQGRRDKDGHGLSLFEGPAWIAEHRAALAARAAPQKGEGT